MSIQEQFQADVLQHQALIHKICRVYRDTKEEREDLFQEILYQLWRAYPGFEQRSKVTTWMYRIGLNTAMATFRKSKLAVTHEVAGVHQVHQGGAGDDENMERLMWAVRQLNDAERALVALFLDDLSYQEISEVMGVSENNVGVRLNRVKNKIRKLLNV